MTRRTLPANVPQCQAMIYVRDPESRVFAVKQTAANTRGIGHRYIRRQCRKAAASGFDYCAQHMPGQSGVMVVADEDVHDIPDDVYDAITKVIESLPPDKVVHIPPRADNYGHSEVEQAYSECACMIHIAENHAGEVKESHTSA